MDLVDEKHVAFLQIGQQRGDVAGFLDCRTGSRTQLGAHFVRDDVGERRFAESWRAGQQNMVERFATSESGFHVNAQVLLDLTLADVFLDSSRAQR